MRLGLVQWPFVVGLAVALSGTVALGQSGDAARKHIDAAKAAAGQEWAWLYNTLCVEALGRVGKPAPPQAAPAAGPPPRQTWHAEPLKVFDNVYWLGQTEYSAWAITTSEGIILMDAIFDYSVRDEVVDGLKKLGLDPASIKYAIMGHWHGDHAAGAQTLQELYGTKIIMAQADWDSVEKDNPKWRPQRDIVATDGMKVTLGDTTVTVYITPGHTQGTLSSIIPVKDGGKPYVAAYWGGTMYNWIGRTTGPGMRKPFDEYGGKPETFWFNQYATNADRFLDIATKAGADVLMSNHTNFDNSKLKMPLLALRKPGDAFHPYVIGKAGVSRYLTTVSECAKAGALMAN
jgi:metallo-beta-lactamase class B